MQRSLFPATKARQAQFIDWKAVKMNKLHQNIS